MFCFCPMRSFATAERCARKSSSLKQPRKKRSLKSLSTPSWQKCSPQRRSQLSLPQLVWEHRSFTGIWRGKSGRIFPVVAAFVLAENGVHKYKNVFFFFLLLLTRQVGERLSLLFLSFRHAIRAYSLLLTSSAIVGLLFHCEVLVQRLAYHSKRCFFLSFVAERATAQRTRG